MEPAHEGVAPGHRYPDAGVDIFGEARVIGGGEGDVALEAKGARRPAERPFGHEMDRVGREQLQHVMQPRRREQRQADLGIGRAGQGAEAVGPEHLDLVALGLQQP